MRFLVFDQTTWRPDFFGTEVGTYSAVRELSLDNLAAEASNFGVGDRKNAAARAMTMDELINIPEREFVLYPVLKEGAYCLIYGGTGAAKTWFALHVAIAISQGASPLDNWTFRGKPRNVLYVAGEMEIDALGSRIKVLLAREKTNLRFRLVKYEFDLTTETDQAKVVDLIRECESRVVIIDNLSTLAANGHTEGQFEKILKFFKYLQRQGITVLMVHHENREGGFKGSGKIELVADQSLHLFNTGKGDKIELLVKAEKIRMTARSEQGSFRTEFDTKNPYAVWPVFPLTEEERRRLNEDDPLDEIGRNIGKKRNNRQLAWRFMTDDARAVAIIDDMLSGCPDDVIAANLVVREQALRIFKDEQGICEDALKMHLEEAAREVSREIGPDTPPKSDVLAPKIWALIKKERTKK
jgi:KaiC/GvpD/RAD55 family RecA-like ATPase